MLGVLSSRGAGGAGAGHLGAWRLDVGVVQPGGSQAWTERLRHLPRNQQDRAAGNGCRGVERACPGPRYGPFNRLGLSPLVPRQLTWPLSSSPPLPPGRLPHVVCVGPVVTCLDCGRVRALIALCKMMNTFSVLIKFFCYSLASNLTRHSLGHSLHLSRPFVTAEGFELSHSPCTAFGGRCIAAGPPSPAFCLLPRLLPLLLLAAPSPPRPLTRLVRNHLIHPLLPVLPLSLLTPALLADRPPSTHNASLSLAPSTRSSHPGLLSLPLTHA